MIGVTIVGTLLGIGILAMGFLWLDEIYQLIQEKYNNNQLDKRQEHQRILDTDVDVLALEEIKRRGE